MDPVVRQLVDHYGMEDLPIEGTFFVNTYRSTERTAAGGPVGTAMLGLYCADPASFSRFHRLVFDEVWHFYRGDPMRLVLLHPDGTSEVVVLGPDLATGQRVQHVVRAGTWQAGELAPGGAWALFGCTMAPGFIGDCFEGGHASALLASHPDRADDIARLAVPDDHETLLPEGYVG